MSTVYALNRKAQVKLEDLQDMRRRLRNKQLALECLGYMLCYADILLRDCEHRHPHSIQCMAEVEFGNDVFRFRREDASWTF
jgi:hypothetical protein